MVALAVEGESVSGVLVELKLSLGESLDSLCSHSEVVKVEVLDISNEVVSTGRADLPSTKAVDVQVIEVEIAKTLL